MAKQRVTILGATGSVGVNTLEVINKHPDDFEIFALTANNNVADLFQQCLDQQPTYAVLRDAAAANHLAAKLHTSGIKTKVLAGREGLYKVANDDAVDIVMAAIVGAAGLEASLAAARAGKRLLLANKESLVMSGALFMCAVADNGTTLLPIDSEHNAIYQCLANGAKAHAQGIKRVFLTGSGGPLLRTPLRELAKVTPHQACKHPNWNMGRKISVDSATMMNKGLELIEAKWLFQIAPEHIEILLHPQSIVHSMVEYVDGSVLAQLGNPDMRIPIAHGLAWPRRIESGATPLDFMQQSRLEFEVLNRDRFPCIVLAESAAHGPESWPIALNAANEVAVDYFLRELIRFTDIPLVIETVLHQTESIQTPTVKAILEVDAEARIRAQEKSQRLAI